MKLEVGDGVIMGVGFGRKGKGKWDMQKRDFRRSGRYTFIMSNIGVIFYKPLRHEPHVLKSKVFLVFEPSHVLSDAIFLPTMKLSSTV